MSVWNDFVIAIEKHIIFYYFCYKRKKAFPCTESFPKLFQQITHHNTHEKAKRCGATYVALKNFRFNGESVRRSSVWGRFVSGDCMQSPALLRLYVARKTTPNKRAAKPYKTAMNWTQVTQKKQQQAQVNVRTIYSYIHTHICRF